ncbi:Isoprenylcysteine alpha-carbonyl methylesterase ICME [Phytophthora cinnamomi]|uniref:Isoprenylcysteine alpha-carbonyl methylesterase ICME n=1 Tax=Phytophthora cinnamomi TaxID=4785 RepID=UPI00355A3590|nr:Isoprenylcysteine alpha-carbonyl methylesterase ICME [Phytophthora cinnamomi]
MEGYLIRVPVEACFPDSRPAWRQRADASAPVRSRLLYYVIEEGYLRGYESPDAVDEPVESFQLTTHRIEVNAMYSLNIFELKARTASVPPVQQFVEDTSSSSSDSSSDDDDSSELREQAFVPQIAVSSSVEVVSGSYHVVFFAANKDLVKMWSMKLLNWNRFVFGSSDELDEAGLKQAKADIIVSLRAVNAADRFLRPVELRTTDVAATTSSDDAANTMPPTDQSSVIPAPVDHTSITTMGHTPTTLTPTEMANITSPPGFVEVVKPSDSLAQTSTPWWITPFGRSRKISSYSLRR